MVRSAPRFFPVQVERADSVCVVESLSYSKLSKNILLLFAFVLALWQQGGWSCACSVQEEQRDVQCRRELGAALPLFASLPVRAGLASLLMGKAQERAELWCQVVHY